MDVLEKITQFADAAHGAQTRKYSADRYIVHPVRVMEQCRAYTQHIPVLAAALLHDVLEDTHVTKKELHHFLQGVLPPAETDKTVALVVELTDVYTKEKYPRWNRRKRKRKEAERIKQTSAESQTIKYADTIDNCKEIAVHDPEFAAVFLLECKSLLQQIDKGNPQLYAQALATVNEALQTIPRPLQKKAR